MSDEIHDAIVSALPWSVLAAYENARAAREEMTHEYDALRARHTEAVYALVRELHDSGEAHPQSAAARLLKVSSTVVSRHMKRARATGLATPSLDTP